MGGRGTGRGPSHDIDLWTDIRVGAAKAGPNTGPFVTLGGDKREKQFDINIRIAVDPNGVFTGVYSTDGNGSETLIPISEWNEQFEKQNPRGQ